MKLRHAFVPLWVVSFSDTLQHTKSHTHSYTQTNIDILERLCVACSYLAELCGDALVEVEATAIRKHPSYCHSLVSAIAKIL